MEVLLYGIAALLLLCAVLYVQKLIPRYTKGAGKIWGTRSLLVIVGIAFGLTGASYVSGQFPKIFAVLIGIGMVHLPAAVVLFVKSQRGEGKS